MKACLGQMLALKVAGSGEKEGCQPITPWAASLCSACGDPLAAARHLAFMQLGRNLPEYLLEVI